MAIPLETRLLSEIPVPFPDPFTCKVCFNPDAPESLRRQGVFSSNASYVRHLRNLHKVDPSKGVVYFCSVCIFKGTLKQVKSHRCPGLNPFISDASVSPSRIDPATKKHCLVSKLDPPAPPSASPMASTSIRKGRDSSLDFFPDNRQALCSRPDEFLAAINSAMNDFDGLRPLCLDAAFRSLSLTPSLHALPRLVLLV
ncbi:hypothetical protein TNCV_2277171 [Trichonephila clavipes]|nr:hypothetical protein TNCV_2277171 [Trichonephila clavipes]